MQCSGCGATFHAAAGTEAWTCKRCGRRNVAPLEAATTPSGSRSRPRREPTGWSRLSPRAKLAVIGIPMVVLVAVLIGLLTFRGDGGGGRGTPANAKLAVAKRTYCHDLSVLQIGFRGPALDRFLTKMQRDIVLYRKAGDHASVNSLVEIQAAATQLKGALKKNTGVSPAITRLDRAISIGPSCS